MVSFSYKLANEKTNSVSKDTFNRLYVFGDSLSDPGNLFNSTTAVNDIFSNIDSNLAQLAPIQPPVPPYDNQGKFTNGNPQDPNRSIWVDFLADDLDIPPVVSSTSLTVNPDPSFLPPPNSSLAPAAVINTESSLVENNFNYGGQTAANSVNFAFGGAKSGNENILNPDPIPPNPPVPGLNPNLPGVSGQINSFIDDIDDLSTEQTNELGNGLYAIWAGANDIDPDLSGDAIDLNQPVDNLEISIKNLYNDADARNFIVFNVPDLGARPIVEDPQVAQNLTNATEKYNELLIQKISDLDSELSDINITPVDVKSLAEFTIDNPEAFGIQNTEDSFLTSATVGENPDEYLSWDGNHPSRAFHEIIGEFVYNNLQAANNSENALVVGDSGINILIGGSGNDTLKGNSGNDLLNAGFGDDTLKGGVGDDLLNAGFGDDKLNGGSGNDKLNGSIGNDTLKGGVGDDLLDGGIGDDKLNGGLGKDTYIFGSDILDGQMNIDTIDCFQTDDILDFTSYLNAGGTISFTRESEHLLKVNLLNLSNEIEDVVNISGSQTALSAAEAAI